MKKKTLLKSIWILLVMCGVSANAGAQDLKSILSGVAKAVVGNKATTASSIIGTWTYSGPECQFESENLLAKAGGEMAAKEVEEKMIAVYNKVGMNNIRYTFNEDGTYSYQMKKRIAFPENSQIRLLFQQHGQEQRPDPPVSMIRGDAQVIQQGPARPPQPQKTGTNNLIAVKQAPGAVEPIPPQFLYGLQGLQL